MIIVKLNGGLGNQMFQYAVGRSLAKRLNVELKLDLNNMRMLDSEKMENINKVHFYYRLHFFNIKENYVNQDDVARVIKASSNFSLKIKNILMKFRKGTHIKYIQEKHFEFDPDILNENDDIYLDGFWQSEKYFQNITDIIRKEFTLKEPLKDENLGLSQQIIDTNSVFILVRRGAMVHISRTNAIHGYCRLKFYEKCVEEIAAKIHNPTFFVFSDEPEWTKANFKIDYPTVYISHNGRKYYHEDLRLMSMCKHAITSNSTWGWWGAWLISNHEKIVYAPQRWFNLDYSTKDLFPPKWILIDEDKILNNYS